MLVSRTPFRVSFVGGGTDLPGFYRHDDYGCVISAAIDRHVYIAANTRFDGQIRAAYSTSELVQDVAELKNGRMRAALERVGVTRGIEVFSISDVPKRSGLGGSSSFTVGLLKALYAHQGQAVFPERLAREACDIEINVLGDPVGKQDQYAAAIGGLNYIRFLHDGTVEVRPILIEERLVRGLFESLVFIYLGQAHDAAQILDDVTRRMQKNRRALLKMRDLTDQLHDELRRGNIDPFVPALRENWELKKSTSNGVSSASIEELYDWSIRNGALAGKVLGAGGGGFLMMVVPLERQARFLERLPKAQAFKFSVDWSGSRIVYQPLERSDQPERDRAMERLQRRSLLEGGA